MKREKGKKRRGRKVREGDKYRKRMILLCLLSKRVILVCIIVIIVLMLTFT